MRRFLALALIAACGGQHADPNATADAAIIDGTQEDGTAIEHGIRVTLNNLPEHPAAFAMMVAFRDGNGPWQLASAPSGDTYTFDTFSSTWSVAWTCSAASSSNEASTTPSGAHWLRSVVVAEFTTAERTSLTMDTPDRCTDRLPPVLQVSGAIANAPAGTGRLYVNLLDQYTTADASYSLRARLGVHDLVVRKLDSANERSTFGTLATFVERNLSIASSQHDLDLATAMPTQAFDVTVPTGSKAQATTLFYTKSGTAVPLGRTTTPLQTFALDPAQVDPTDVFDQQVELDSVGHTAIMTNATLTPGPLTVRPPDQLGTASSAVVTATPYPLLQTMWPVYPDAVGYTWVATQVPTPDNCFEPQCSPIAWTALVSPGIAGASPTYQLPDLSALPGWDPEFAFTAGVEIDGYAEADTSSAGASDFPPVTPPAAGTQRTYVRSDFTVTP
jgi:hypothetical protein